MLLLVDGWDQCALSETHSCGVFGASPSKGHEMQSSVVTQYGILHLCEGLLGAI
jgi:hypothetical protein